MVVELSKYNWRKGILASICIGLSLILVVVLIGVREIDITHSIVSGLISGFLFSTSLAGATTFWFSFSRKQPWTPAIISLIPIILGIGLAYLCYESLEITDASHDTAVAQGLADLLQMISMMIATGVAIVFSLVMLLRHPTTNMEEE